MIAPSASLGEGVVIEDYVRIEEDVTIGANTRIRSFVELRAGTVIGEDCYIDSYVVSSGDNRIGDGVMLRYQAIIARGCDIGDGCYICPQVMTNNLDHHRQEIGGAKVGKSCFIGTQTVLAAGIEIADETVVGACSLVTKTIKEPGVYIGVPAKRR